MATGFAPLGIAGSGSPGDFAVVDCHSRPLMADRLRMPRRPKPDKRPHSDPRL
jgi:hypothetical protein